MTSTLSEGIQMPRFELLALEQVVFNKVNRDKNPKHIARMKSLIQANGMVDAVKVVPSKENDKYYIVEGQHRYQALVQLGCKQIPCLILDWVDPEDEDSILEVIISMNTNNKNWTLLDYARSYCERKVPNYCKIKSLMIKYANTMSYSTVLAVYSGDEKGTTNHKKGKLKFTDEEFSDFLIEQFDNLITTYGNKRVESVWVRKVSRFLLDPDNKGNRYDYWNKIETVVVGTLLGPDNFLPVGTEEFNSWAKKVTE